MRFVRGLRGRLAFSLLLALGAVCLPSFAAPGFAAATYVLAGSPDGKGAIPVGGDLDVYVNGTLAHTDGSAAAGQRSPIAIEAKAGDVLRLVVRAHEACAALSRVYLTDAQGRSTVAAQAFDGGCTGGRSERVAFDTTLVVVDLAAAAPAYVERSLPGSTTAGAMRGPGGALFGVTYDGGRDDRGTIYRVSPDLGGVAVLHSFTGAIEGAEPRGELTLHDSILYGTTARGGLSDRGTIFAFDVSTNSFRTLYSFDDDTPVSALLIVGDYLYAAGGSPGQVFRIRTDGSEFTTLHVFSGADGARPGALTLGPGGYLYGAALYGGAAACAPAPDKGCGTVFRLRPDGAGPGQSGFQVLYGFDGTARGRAFPQATLVAGSDGRLYGTTSEGIFSLAADPAAPDLRLHYIVPSGATERRIVSTLIEALDDRLVVAESGGGTAAIYSLTKAGTDRAVQHEFPPSRSLDAYGALHQDAAGTIIGTTGTSDVGTSRIFAVRRVEQSPSASVTDATALANADVASASPGSRAFHFLAPLSSTPGNPAQFDPTLLNYLVVDVCTVSDTSCSLVKEFTSQGSSSEQIRIETNGKDGSYYIVNWDTRSVTLRNQTYRITVFVAGLQVGSIDVAPPLYNTFPRTWPIKFQIAPDPAIRVRVLRSIGQSAGQIAWALRREFNLSREEVAALLAADQDPFTQKEIDSALEGVFQDGVEIPATTKIADPATRNALTSYDPVKGTMVFSAVTDLLKNLRTGDVLVSEPAAVAPYGLLRKVTSIQKKPGQVTLGTVQALINEAVRKGTFHAEGDLKPRDVAAVQAIPGVTVRTASLLSPAPATDIGDGFDFSRDIDVTLDSQVSGDGFSGSGHVRIQGKERFTAGYNMGFGVEPCLDLPPVCVDRVEAHMGLNQYSEIHVNGNLDGTLDKETILDTEYFKPIVFFIGPVPVVLVPVVNAIAGVHGEAHVAFGIAGEGAADMNLGAKWTDPGDGGQGWENVSSVNLPMKGSYIDASLSGNMTLRGYGKADAKLLLYGVAGPALDARIGIRGDAQFPGNPIWKLFADGDAEVDFQVDIGGVLKLQEYRLIALPPLAGCAAEGQSCAFELQLAAAANQAPHCDNRTDMIPANPTVPITLGPNGGGFLGFFNCTDPEGEDISYDPAHSTNLMDGPNKDGVLPFGNGLLRPTFLTGGIRRIDITARDPEGNTRSFSLMVNVVNTPPVVTIGTVTNTVPATVQYFVTASAYDWESQQFLPCSQIAWSVSSPDTVMVQNVGGCKAVVIFAQTGSRTVTVTATDFFGATSVQTVTVTVTTAPSNPPPFISSMSVVATDGPDCFLDGFLVFHCEVPDGSLLYNGQNRTADTYYQPLTLKLSASDPNGDTLTIKWFCQVGSSRLDVIDQGGGTATCNPGATGNDVPVAVYAVVSDGVTTVSSEVRHFRFLLTVQ